jgi:DNA-directed RNA polymerase delta subunit
MDSFCQMAITFDHTTDIMTTYLNGIVNSSINSRVMSATQSDVDLGTFYGSYISFSVNAWSDRSSYAMNEIDDIKFFNTALTQEDIDYYYTESI